MATDVMRADPGGSLALVCPDGVREIDFTLHRDVYEVTLESFAAGCGSSGPQAISGLEGLRALSVAPAVNQSSTSGRTEAVEIEPPATVRSPNRDLVDHPSEIAL